MGFFGLFGKSSDAKRSQESTRRQKPSASGRIAARMLQAAGTGRLESTWLTTPQTADAIIYQDWGSTVARSRQMANDADHFKKFIQLCRDNVAGPTGFKFSAAIKDADGKLDLLASKAIEAAWLEFSFPGNYEISGTMSRSDAERLAITSAAQDGECIGIIRTGRSVGPWGIAVQMVDPVLLDHRQYEPLTNGNVIRHGIEFDSFNRPVNYWFKNYDERLVGYVTHSGREYNVVPARDVVHWFIPEMVGQKRGLPWARTALWRGRMLSAFEDAAITNARVGAAKMGFFRDPDGDDFDEDELPMDAEAGVFENIGNREMANWNPQFPDQMTESFMRSMLRSLAAGMGVSYHNLANDLTSVNFSSIRQGALDEREVWKGLQESFSLRWCWPIYERWLERALLAQSIRVNDKPLKFERVEKYKQVTFRGRRWAWIDPSSEQSANERAVGQAFTSRSRVIEDLGNDPQDVWEEMERENAELKLRGITPSAPAGTAPAPTEDSKQIPAQDQKDADA